MLNAGLKRLTVSVVAYVASAAPTCAASAATACAEAVVVAYVASAVVACAAAVAAEPAPSVPAGYLTETQGFVDIDLPITQISQDPGSTRIVARGVILGKEVGLEIDFPSPPQRSPGQPSSALGTAQVRPRGQASAPLATAAPDQGSSLLGTAQVRTLGAASDNFVALLDSRYKIPIPSKTMVAAVTASVVSLAGDPVHLREGVTQMKFLFFDSGPQDRYAEVYINVDAGKRVLGFHEKDEDYRKALLLALTQGT